MLIGDGAYTGGMVHEALNNVEKDLRLIIVLNENEMSISKNIGRFAKHLSKLRSRSISTRRRLCLPTLSSLSVFIPLQSSLMQKLAQNFK